jgi:integrase
MAEASSKALTAVSIKRITKAGYHRDGGSKNLYLQVGPTGTKSWLMRFSFAGRAREMGLGSVDLVSLAEARERVVELRKMLRNGIDPIENRRATRIAALAANGKTITFDEAAAAYIKTHESGWKSAKHASQWASTLSAYASPVFGRLRVSTIDTGLVTRAVEPIWRDRTETAKRVRGRIESVLSWATVRGYRSGANPAAWRGHLRELLPSPRKVSPLQHHRSLPYADVPAFIQRLRIVEGVSARALEFAILTACRSGEVRGARWDEIDLQRRVWTVPRSRMKAGVEHEVPLPAPAVRLLTALPRVDGDDTVFPAPRGGPLSDMALTAALRRLRVDAVAHGFRSSFRQWSAEQTAYPREVAEAALAHKLPDAVERACQRGTLWPKRVLLMDAWGSYCDKPRAATAKVVPIKRRTAR